MSSQDGIAYDDLPVGRTLGTCRYNATREEILDYIKNTGIQRDKFVLDDTLIVPASMVFVYTLRAIFANNIPIGGAVLAGHDIECIGPIKENEGIVVDIVIKDKYIKKERKYVLLDFVIKNLSGEIKVIDTMRAIWPQ